MGQILILILRHTPIKGHIPEMFRFKWNLGVAQWNGVNVLSALNEGMLSGRWHFCEIEVSFLAIKMHGIPEQSHL